MDNRRQNESEAAAKLKKLDFSRFSSAHKDKLWETISALSEPYQLSNDELDLIAAAGRQTKGEADQGNTCPRCQSRNVATRHEGLDKVLVCRSCGFETRLPR